MLQTIRKIDDIIQNAVPANDSLVNGNLSLVVYNYTCNSVFGDEKYRQKFESTLATVLQNFMQGTAFNNFSLLDGITGLGTVLNLLNKDANVSLGISSDELVRQQYFVEMAISQIEQSRLDYLYGAFGILKYLLSLPPSPECNKSIELIILKIYDKHKSNDFWFANDFRNDRNVAVINLGFAHGLTGFMIVLLDVYSRRIARSEVDLLLRRGFANLYGMIRRNSFAGQNDAIFPLAVDLDRTPIFERNMLGWCYGDLNESLLFYKASVVLENQKYWELANIIGKNTIKRSGLDKLHDDACFCHGSSGVALTYKILHQYDPNSSYSDFSDYWTQITLKNIGKQVDDEFFKDLETNLLSGLVGVNLALLSLCYNKDLAWPEIFLLNK